MISLKLGQFLGLVLLANFAILMGGSLATVTLTPSFPFFGLAAGLLTVTGSGLLMMWLRFKVGDMV